jgi:hypothetical protein
MNEHASSGIDPTQAGFWERIGHRPLTAADTEPYGVEFLTDGRRLRAVRQRYPVPTAIDIGHGIFGAQVGLVYVDDDTGRAVAYAAPELSRSYRAERRQRGLCPVCGARIRLSGDTTDGRFIASCQDAFTRVAWRARG